MLPIALALLSPAFVPLPAARVRLAAPPALRRVPLPELQAEGIASAIEASGIDITSSGASLAYELLEKRVANSRVGPMARHLVGFCKKFGAGCLAFASPAQSSVTMKALIDALWQPVDLVAITVLWFTAAPVLRALHRFVSWVDPRIDGEFESSAIATLERPLRNLAKLLGALLLTDAAAYTLAINGDIAQGLAGRIPDVFDTVGYALILGQAITGLKTWWLRKKAGLSADEKMTGGVAISDRLWGAGLWTAVAWSSGKVLTMEMGFRLKSVVAIGGLSSVVFGLACQTPLSNVVQGLIIAISGPFATGEKIQCGGITGTVEDFGWYQSRLRTGSNTLITLPNSMLSGKEVVNLSRRTAKKESATLRLSYDDLPKLEVAIGKLRAFAASLPVVASDVYLTDFTDGAVEVQASITLEPGADDRTIRQDFLLGLSKTLDGAGVAFS